MVIPGLEFRGDGGGFQAGVSWEAAPAVYPFCGRFKDDSAMPMIAV
jgi:hypothetical protein